MKLPRKLCRYLLSPTELHVFFALAALASCAPLLFPNLCPPGFEAEVMRDAGIVLMSSFIVSAVLMLFTAVVHLLRLSNLHAAAQLLKWLLVWVVAAGLFALMAIAADVPAPRQSGSSAAIQESDALNAASNPLLGPAALGMVLRPENTAADTIAAAPNLCRLESENEELLRVFLQRSPRWRGVQNSDTFYSHPGHPVFIMPTPGGVPGLVHVSFRHLVEGDPLPQGYIVVKPGDAFPTEHGDASQVPDLALDLGRNHYLLLAWRGAAHAETAHRALNATITAIDSRMQPLAEHPESATIDRMLAGRRSYEGSEPQIRFAEAPGQEGTYQAELYVNPGQPGTLLFYIIDLKTNKTERILYCPALYSGDKNELFRHDIPDSLTLWGKQRDIGPLAESSPVFTIRTGSDHQYFGVALEVWFKPADSNRRRFRLLRRCYNVLPYDDSTTAPKPAEKPEPQAGTVSEH